MPLQFQPCAGLRLPIDASAMTPDWANAYSLPEIERALVWQGNRQLPLAELFAVQGSAADDNSLHFEGDCRHVHRLGQALSAGSIHVEGSIGRHLGANMTGGEILVAGDAGDWTGAEMHGGRLCVQGDCGDYLGGIYAGSTRGMTGGEIAVGGRAGHEVGRNMRRGLIAVAGAIGDYAGHGMLAGTIIAGGPCGARPGAEMRRGTIVLLGNPPALLPTFRAASRGAPVYLAMLARRLRALGMNTLGDALAAAVAKEVLSLSGDHLHGGRGEIVLAG